MFGRLKEKDTQQGREEQFRLPEGQTRGVSWDGMVEVTSRDGCH
jgi:hypothetical protein